LKDLKPIQDGDQGPIYRFTLKDGGVVSDRSSGAAAYHILDSTGTILATRPAHIIQAKANGQIDLLLKGLETDWEGQGKDLILLPLIYYAEAPGGGPATNLLVNPSFDTGSTVADNWVQAGTLGGMIYEVRQDDPAPPVIFGKCQRSLSPAGGGSTAYIKQNPAVTVAKGDPFSFGVWHRAYAVAGSSIAGAEYYADAYTVFATDEVKVAFASGDLDWHFVYGTRVSTLGGSSLGLNLVNLDARGYEIRYDDAFLFRGNWRIFHADARRLPVKACTVIEKLPVPGPDLIPGAGGFEVDSDADGVADCWAKTTVSGATFSLDQDPANNSAGAKSQKVVLTATTGNMLRTAIRGNFLAGQRYRLIVTYKNAGAMAGSPAAGDFGPTLHTEEFDGPYEASGASNFNTGSQASFTPKVVSLTLANNHNVLVLDIKLDSVTGTVWLDSAELSRI
jgi:hypothetical protein